MWSDLPKGVVLDVNGYEDENLSDNDSTMGGSIDFQDSVHSLEDMINQKIHLFKYWVGKDTVEYVKKLRNELHLTELKEEIYSSCIVGSLYKILDVYPDMINVESKRDFIEFLTSKDLMSGFYTNVTGCIGSSLQSIANQNSE